MLASAIPNCVSYDPTYAYELAVIVQDGMRRMYENMESVFYYITTMNENYRHGALPKGTEEDILKGMYLLEDGGAPEYKLKKTSKKTESDLRVRLLGSGTILREVRQAARTLREDFEVAVDVWSVTSFNELRREALAITRENMLHPSKKSVVPFVTRQLARQQGPVIATTDYMKAYSDQIREYVPDSYRVLGTDGFGRSDSREKLRHFFEVDSKFIVLAALTELQSRQLIAARVITDYMKKAGINQDKANPLAQ
jgi:pyruvate dehydrogenase E1 component